MDSDTAGSHSCMVCGAPTHDGYRRCFCCNLLVRQLRMPLVPLVAMETYRVGDVLHHRLRGYKDASEVEVRTDLTRRLGALAQRWLVEHGDALGRRLGRWDPVVTVPSSSRPAGSSVDRLVGAVPTLSDRMVPGVLVRGPAALDHLVADRRGFVVDGSVAPQVVGRRALVFDDSVVTGARAQSAVAALRSAGIEVAGVLVVGRSVASATG